MLLSTHSLDPCCGGSPIIPLLVHQPAYLASSFITPVGSVHKSRGDSVVRIWGLWVQLKRWCVSCAFVLQGSWHSGDGCDLASTLCNYDLMKGDCLGWARVRRVRRGSTSSELLMCCGGVRSILLLSLVDRCLETIDVCIWRKFVLLSVVVTVWGLWERLLCSGRC